MMDAFSSGSPEAPPNYAAPPTPGNAANACSAWLLQLGQPCKPRMGRLEARARKGCAGDSCVRRQGSYVTSDSRHEGPVGRGD